MPLASGIRLGSYTIAAPIGAGGMGEVYRAMDTRLGRQVAIKVLPSEVARDPDRLARFEREAQLLASLNHPNIAGIYGLDEADGKAFLVLELVEGEDLQQRLKRGPVPVDEALALALQLAAALEAAHEKGIVHRDLKPANVKVTAEGQVKVLDFGLAKAYGADRSGPVLDPGNSPTMTEAATSAGMILGTAAYMSPEQARGRAVDKRADVWAFGVVLYEMLTGQRLFTGETISDTLAAVLTREPDLGALPPGVPPRIRALLARCLRKDPKERLRDIGDARIELQEKESVPAPIAAADDRPRKRPRWRWLVLTAALGLAGGAVLGAWAMRRFLVTEPPTFRQLSFERGLVHSARFAPDGQTVLYGAALEGRPLALYSTRTDGFGSRAMDVGEADIAGISREGQMALLLGRHHVGTWLRVGTLATVSLAGGTPREVLGDVYDADISPDGQQFAVVLQQGDHQVLQYPIGKELYRTEGWIAAPRISPDGKRVAFVNHRVWGDDLGDVRVVGEDGKMASLVPEYQYMMGVAWGRRGADVWFSGAEDPGGGLLGVATLDGHVRRVLRTPALIRLSDLARDGRLLVLTDDTRALLAGRLAGDSAERPYVGSPSESVAAIADDGAIFAGNNGDLVVNGEYGIQVRRAGGAPVQLGLGSAVGMTPDGKFVFSTGLSSKRSVLTKRPVGAGQVREFDLGDVLIQTSGGRTLTCAADGNRVAFMGQRAGHGRVAYVMDLETSRIQPVSEEGAYSALISPDGEKVAVGDLLRGPQTCSASSKQCASILGLGQKDLPLAWSPDGRGLLVWDRTLPARIYHADLVTGRRELVQEITAPDPVGLMYAFATFSANGRYHLMRYRRNQSQLYVMEPHEGTRDIFVGVKLGDGRQ
ncbi:MAG TPA: protein kinase [Candidatus Polarisedimenticolaceae bacterium]|nr:protein kinase [Candidatus Polarisedimenticolaceae bacterium]